MSDQKECPCAAVLKAQEELEAHRNRLHRGDVSMAQIDLKLENIEKKVDKLEGNLDKKFERLSEEIEELKLKPAKRWDGVVTVVITLVVGMLIGLFFTQVGVG